MKKYENVCKISSLNVTVIEIFKGLKETLRVRSIRRLMNTSKEFDFFHEFRLTAYGIRFQGSCIQTQGKIFAAKGKFDTSST